MYHLDHSVVNTPLGIVAAFVQRVCVFAVRLCPATAPRLGESCDCVVYACVRAEETCRWKFIAGDNV